MEYDLDASLPMPAQTLAAFVLAIAVAIAEIDATPVENRSTQAVLDRLYFVIRQHPEQHFRTLLLDQELTLHAVHAVLLGAVQRFHDLTNPDLHA